MVLRALAEGDGHARICRHGQAGLGQPQRRRLAHRPWTTSDDPHATLRQMVWQADRSAMSAPCVGPTGRSRSQPTDVSPRCRSTTASSAGSTGRPMRSMMQQPRTSPAGTTNIPCRCEVGVEPSPPMTERGGVKSAAPTQDDESATPTSGPGMARMSSGVLPDSTSLLKVHPLTLSYHPLVGILLEEWYVLVRTLGTTASARPRWYVAGGKEGATEALGL